MGAGVVRIKGTRRALALSVDCNGRFVYLDPFLGAQHAVAEAARNVACAGALPIGATNCLNFGNPEKPDVMWQFVRAVEGMGAACRALDVPITGWKRQPLQRDRRPRGPADARPRRRRPDRGRGSRRAADVPGRRRRGRDARREPRGAGWQRVPEGDSRISCAAFRRRSTWRVRPRCSVCWSTESAAGVIQSAHDCAEGGFAITLAECCFDTGLGVSSTCLASQTPRSIVCRRRDVVR